MPITVIPAPPQPDPMQQLGQWYELYSQMQMAPLRQQLLQGQIQSQQVEQESARQAARIAQQDAASRQAASSREAERYDLQKKQQNTTAQGYVQAGQAAGLNPEALAALTANAPSITAENEALVVPPEVQKYLFQQRLAANPIANLQYQKAQQELANDKQHFGYVGALIQKMKEGDGASGKGLSAALNTASDNLNMFDKEISQAEIDAASVEPAAIQKFLETSVTGTQIQLDRDNPGNVWQVDPKTKQPIVDPVTGYKKPIPQFEATWNALIPALDAKRQRVELLRARKNAYLTGLKQAQSQVADAIVTMFDNPVGIDRNPAVPGAMPSPTATSADQLENLVDMLTKADNSGGSTLRTIVTDPDLHLPPDPALVDRWVQLAFPSSDNSDATKRAASIVRLKALLMKAQPAPPVAGRPSVVE